jgi:hypothetical protein
MISLSVVSKLKNDERTHAHHVGSTQSHSDRYLLLMDAFPSALGGCACRRVYVRGSLIIGLVYVRVDLCSILLVRYFNQ